MRASVLPLAVVGLLSAHAVAAPVAITHAGHLLNASDTPVSTPALSMTFRILDRPNPGSGEQPVFSATCDVSVTNGFYSVVLGADACAGDGLTTDDFRLGESRWLEVAIGGLALTPRMKLNPAPIASLALDSERLGGLTSDAFAKSAEVASAFDTLTLAWSRLTDVPPGLADGDQDTTYDADGTTLELVDGTFAVRTQGLTNAHVAAPANTSLVLKGDGSGGAAWGRVAWTDLSGVPASLADGAVAWSELTGVPADLADGKVAWSELVGVPSDFADGKVSWSELAGMPTDFADGKIDWSEISGIPSDIADGDRDTTYIAGAGLSLSGQTFSLSSDRASFEKVTGGLGVATTSGIAIGTTHPGDDRLLVRGDARIESGSLRVVDGPVRIGNSILDAYSLNLPAHGLSYSPYPLHLRTDWECGVTNGPMYHLEFKGYAFNDATPYHVVATGYLYGDNGHINNRVLHVVGYDKVTLSTYCASAAKGRRLTFKLTATKDWHASDLVVNFVGGPNNYLRQGADSFRIVEAIHAPSNL